MKNRLENLANCEILFSHLPSRTKNVGRKKPDFCPVFSLKETRKYLFSDDVRSGMIITNVSP
jgi:hypothetical protein